MPGDASASAGLFGGASSSAPAAKAAEPAAEEDDDEVDLFGSDDEDDAETERIKAERVAEYQAKKAAKLADKGPGPVAKSIVTLQVKPWDDETDMEALEKSVRSIEKDGLGKLNRRIRACSRRSFFLFPSLGCFQARPRRLRCPNVADQLGH